MKEEKHKTCKKHESVTIKGEGEFGCFVCLWQKHIQLQNDNVLLQSEVKGLIIIIKTMAREMAKKEINENQKT